MSRFLQRLSKTAPPAGSAGSAGSVENTNGLKVLPASRALLDDCWSGMGSAGSKVSQQPASSALLAEKPARHQDFPAQPAEPAEPAASDATPRGNNGAVASHLGGIKSEIVGRPGCKAIATWHCCCRCVLPLQDGDEVVETTIQAGMDAGARAWAHPRCLSGDIPPLDPLDDPAEIWARGEFDE